MHELRKISRDGPNDSIEGEYKTNNKHVIVTPNFLSLPRKYSRANRGKNHKGAPRLFSEQILKDLNHMLNTSIEDAPTFIRILISSMAKSYLKIAHGLLSTK